MAVAAGDVPHRSYAAKLIELFVLASHPDDARTRQKAGVCPETPAFPSWFTAGNSGPEHKR
jgi:hypothetical protein